MLVLYPADTLILEQLAQAMQGLGQNEEAEQLRDHVRMLVPVTS